MLTRCIDTLAQNLDEAQKLSDLLNDFARSLSLLDDFDHKRLDASGTTRRADCAAQTRHERDGGNQNRQTPRDRISALSSDEIFEREYAGKVEDSAFYNILFEAVDCYLNTT